MADKRVPKCPSALSTQVPECPKCLSAQVPECPPSALQMPKCPSARVPSECSPSAQVPECSPSECLKCSNVLWVFLNARPVPECLIRYDWTKCYAQKCFMLKKKKCKKKKMVERNLRNLILKQYQGTDLKSFWNWFGISDLCKDFCKILHFAWAPL